MKAKKGGKIIIKNLDMLLMKPRNNTISENYFNIPIKIKSYISILYYIIFRLNTLI